MSGVMFLIMSLKEDIWVSVLFIYKLKLDGQFTAVIQTTQQTGEASDE